MVPRHHKKNKQTMVLSVDRSAAWINVIKTMLIVKLNMNKHNGL